MIYVRLPSFVALAVSTRAELWGVWGFEAPCGLQIVELLYGSVIFNSLLGKLSIEI